MFDPRDRRTHPFFGGPGAAVGTQHGTRPPNVFVQSESSSDAERVFSVIKNHGLSWTRMKDCPRLRTMLSLLDAELEQILSVNKEVDVRWCARQSAIQRICVLVLSVPRDHGKAGVLFATRLPPTPAPTHRSFVSSSQTPVPVPTHARCHPYVRIGKGPNGYGCERVTGAIIVFELLPPWQTRRDPFAALRHAHEQACRHAGGVTCRHAVACVSVHLRVRIQF